MHKNWRLVGAGLAVLIFAAFIVPAVAAPSADECNIVHVVQFGDTVYSIARRYGVSVPEIANANGLVNPNLIYIGQQLTIPVCRPASLVHVVQAGETLTQISLRYGVSVYAVAQANGLFNPNVIYIGQRLFIPGSTAEPSPTSTSTPSDSAPAPPSSPPDTFPGPWQGEYFDNIDLSGEAYKTREDASIDFDWADGPPAGGMPSNHFSVRWTGTFTFTAGTYRFYARVDDGARIYVDGVEVVSGWEDGSLRTYTGEQALTAGSHTVMVEFYDRAEVTAIQIWWEQLSGPKTMPSPTETPMPTAPVDTATQVPPEPTAVPEPTASPEPTAVPPEPTAVPEPTAPPDDLSADATFDPRYAWRAAFYNNETLEGDPVVTRLDSDLGFEWGGGIPAEGVWPDGFSARWTRTISLKTDHYRFCAMSDDGVRIWVNDELVLDEWHANGGNSFCGTYWVTTGDYPVVVEYYEHGGDALIYVWWEPY